MGMLYSVPAFWLLNKTGKVDSNGEGLFLSDELLT